MKYDLEELPAPLVHATHRVIKDCNQQFASLFGYEPQDLKNTGFHILYPKFSDFLRTGDMWQTHMNDKSVYYDERIMRHADQSQFWCRVRGISTNSKDPFASAIYTFEPIKRLVERNEPKLTARNIQVVALVAQGKKNREIAIELNLSSRTVEMHRARIMKRLGLKNTAHLVAWFERQKY